VVSGAITRAASGATAVSTPWDAMAMVKYNAPPRPAADRAVAPRCPTMIAFVSPIAICARFDAASGNAIGSMARSSAAKAERGDDIARCYANGRVSKPQDGGERRVDRDDERQAPLSRGSVLEHASGSSRQDGPRDPGTVAPYRSKRFASRAAAGERLVYHPFPGNGAETTAALPPELMMSRPVGRLGAMTRRCRRLKGAAVAGGEPTFAEAVVNSEVAPIPAIR